ncbi:MAG: glycoside hydrolase family 88 protein [Bacteroidales bacterium]|nr:glycoside hydrolase family 88 protein [Bacteroidales bacterium]
MPDGYSSNAMNGWKALKKKVKEDGTVTGICRGTAIGSDVEFYNNRKTFNHDPRGLGAMMTAGTEVYLMIEQKE